MTLMSPDDISHIVAIFPNFPDLYKFMNNVACLSYPIPLTQIIAVFHEGKGSGDCKAALHSV